MLSSSKPHPDSQNAPHRASVTRNPIAGDVPKQSAISRWSRRFF
jgi:hypothetical protein